MNLKVFRPALIPLLLMPMLAFGLELSFFGRTPDTSGKRPVQVVSGVLPGVAVVFETTSPEAIILRPAREDEHSTEKHAVYRFEWKKDHSARFYELVSPTHIQELSTQNSQDIANPEGKDYEQKVIQHLLGGGKVLQACIPSSGAAPDAIKIFVVVGLKGEQEQLVVLPEGGIAECIYNATLKLKYPAPANRFTAMANIQVTP